MSFKQYAYAFYQLLIVVQKPFKVFPGCLRELNDHKFLMGKVASFPSSISPSDSFRWERLAGDRNMYEVCSMLWYGARDTSTACSSVHC